MGEPGLPCGPARYARAAGTVRPRTAGLETKRPAGPRGSGTRCDGPAGSSAGVSRPRRKDEHAPQMCRCANALVTSPRMRKTRSTGCDACVRLCRRGLQRVRQQRQHQPWHVHSTRDWLHSGHSPEADCGSDAGGRWRSWPQHASQATWHSHRWLVLGSSSPHRQQATSRGRMSSAAESVASHKPAGTGTAAQRPRRKLTPRSRVGAAGFEPARIVSPTIPPPWCTADRPVPVHRSKTNGASPAVPRAIMWSARASRRPASPSRGTARTESADAVPRIAARGMTAGAAASTAPRALDPPRSRNACG